MTTALHDFDQEPQLVVVRIYLNLKFYFNFLEVPLFVGAGDQRRLVNSIVET